MATRGDAVMPVSAPEVWLRGPIAGVPALLMPAAHCLLQCREEIEAAAAPLTAAELWRVPPGEAATAGFHLRHIAGSIDRLLTYARGAQLGDEQRAALRAEKEPGTPAAERREIVDGAHAAIDQAIAVLRATPVESVLEPRQVGRAGLPSNVLGLLFHIAEHTHRHTGQLVTTARIVRGLSRDGDS